MIPLARPSLEKEELNMIEDVLKSGWLGMGKLVYEFENKLKDYLGAEYLYAVNTGTSALHIALDACGIAKGDEVIVPSLTFVASVQAIVSCGATPVFCEVHEDTLCMDEKDIKNRITKRTKAIMPVHYGGLGCNMDEILNIAKERSLLVVEDAAHAFGSTYKGRKIGTLGDATCFSFDPIKLITSGEGGAVALKNGEIAQKLVKKRILGIDKDTWNRYKNKRSWSYEVQTSGFRYHMSNINAAIGITQLKKIDRFIQRRQEIVKKYDLAFKDVSGIRLLYRDYQETAPFNYTIRVKGKRDELLNYLKENGIETTINYIPNHLQPLFRDPGLKLAVTERIAEEIITLPLYNGMSDEDASLVIDGVKGYFK